MVVYLLSDQAKHVTGQVYTSVGSRSPCGTSRARCGT